MKPEEKARQQIDEQLQAAGWAVQSRDAANLGAARGIAVGEFPLTTGWADYMLFVDKRPIGVIEAKAVGKTLNGNEALVRADYAEDRIYIWVRGPGRRDLLTRIREQFDAIRHTIQGLQLAEKVPIPSHPDLPPVDYKWLRDMERKNIPEFLPPGLTEPLSVGQLLNGVETLTARRARDTKYEVHIHGGRVGVIGDRPEVKDGIHFESSDD